MKMQEIVKTNQKGQLVIPQEMRKALGISNSVPLGIILRDEGLYLYPIEETIAKIEKEGSYVDLLKRTQGSWGRGERAAAEKARSAVELAASQRRKEPW